MPPRIMKHNPAFLTREELVSSFVARQQDLSFVLDHFVENVGASSQHLLIVAPRGMGKTTLVLRAAEALRTEERFSKIWFPLVYAEETYEVTAAAELWLEGLRHLGEYTKNQDLLAEHHELRKEKDEARLYDRALGLLLQFAEKEVKRLVIVIENLHMLLGEQLSEGDAWKLRKTFQTERRLCLLATATAGFDAIQDVKQAFFDQFRTYRLEPLSTEEAQHLWSHVAGREVPAEQMRPLHILTGGNPRLLTILASFAGEISLRDLMGDLVRLVDEHTTYFKSNLDSLPAKERKVYVAVADLWQPSTAREVAEQARLSPSEASALLNRLTQRGAVTASGEERRRLYQLAERMYNIYHLLRRSGGDHTRVKAVVDFMVGFYDPVSLGNVVRAIAEEGKELTGDERRRFETLLKMSTQREVLRSTQRTAIDWTRVFMDAAATGHGKDALDLLSGSALAAPLEPVVAGLHAYLGQAYRAPLEVAEVAADVAERIRQRAIALKSRSEATTGTKASPTPKDSAESSAVHPVSTESKAKPGGAKSTGTKRPKRRKVPPGRMG